MPDINDNPANIGQVLPPARSRRINPDERGSGQRRDKQPRDKRRPPPPEDGHTVDEYA